MPLPKLLVVLTVLVLSPATLLAQATAAGRFGRALAPKQVYGAAERNTIYFVVPMTVECWARIDGAKGAPTILVANEPRHSVTHWELFAKETTGHFGVSLPGHEPPDLVSGQNIADGKWHHLAMVFDGTSVRLHVDGQQVARQNVKKVKPYPDSGPLTFGYIPGVTSNPDVLIDEVRISRGVRSFARAPDAPFTADADTVGLWHFDEDEQAAKTSSFPDASATRNPVRLFPITKDLPPGGGFDGSRLVGGRTRWSDMDFGPFFSSTLIVPSQKQNVTHKAVLIRLGDGHAVAFDTELLRVSAAWSGDFVKIQPFREGLGGPPEVAGDVRLGNQPGPGWAKGNDRGDPRGDNLGPLPRDWGRYRGLYVNGDSVVLSYTVGAVEVLEQPGVEQGKSGPVFSRTLHVGPSAEPMRLAVFDKPAGAQVHAGLMKTGTFETFTRDGRAQAAAVRIADSTGFGWSLEGNVSGELPVFLEVPPHREPLNFRLEMWSGREADLNAFLRDPKTVKPAPDLPALCKGGPPRYPQPVVTKGVLGTGDGPYVVDTLTAPEDNPWKSFLRFGGLDFFSNGDAAVCSVSGDVWVVSGIDDKLEQLKWRRFATGLFQPLGLKVVGDKVYVLGRDQITRLHDLNNDGEADFYENFNNDCKVTTNGHAYATCLETDPAGNFYYTKCGDGTEHGGTMLRVSKDGSKLDVFATGLRNVNGAGAGPNGEITAADNQGEWVPASRLDLVSPGEFLGYQPMSKRNPPPADPGKPLCWMPQNVDNSSGGQVWVTGDRWGPFEGAMLHTSYGAAALLLVLQEKVDGVDQGGVVRFPFSFDSGAMRGRFRPQDGQLYVCGLRGWQTAGAKDACLQRVRYTGKPVHMPAGLNVHRNGIKLSFTCPLDRETTEDVGSYGVLRWNYRWTSEYGSRQWSATNPQQQGYDTLEVKSAKLLEDGKSVFLEVRDMRPVMQMQISYDVEASDGAQVRGDVYNTVHALGPAR